jgi:hypothetical protein
VRVLLTEAELPRFRILIEDEGFDRDGWKGPEKSTLQLKNPCSTK